MQNVAWPTMIVISPNSTPNVWNVELKAMPVTTPGRAIGRTSRKLDRLPAEERVALDRQRSERPEDDARWPSRRSLPGSSS